MGNIISLKNVSFNYDGSKRKVLKNINLEINEGEFVVITGPTGAGKTTLCETLNGVIPNFINGNLEGEIIVDGLNTKENPVYKMASSVGMVFQDPDTQLFGMTVEEDIAFGPANLGYSYEECMERIEKSINDLNIRELRDRKPLELSGGQKQSVTIAGVYAMLPKIIVFDEPTSMLDPVGKERVFSIIKDINKKYKITIVVVEHEMNEIVRHADKVVIMDRGEICLQGNVSEVFTQTDKLKELGLNIPHAIELGMLLKNDRLIDEVPMVPEEMIRELSRFCADSGPHTYIEEKTESEIAASGDEAEEIIEIDNLKHSYLGDTYELDGIDLKIRKGDFVAIIGQNGAGKTTMARHIIGLLKPSQGAIKVNGSDIAEKSVAELSNSVGYVFQNPDDQIFKESVEEELFFGPVNLNKNLELVRENVNEVLSDVGLEKYRKVWPKYLSKGERQRLAMGAIITMDPDIVIVDEPTTGQDWKETLWIMELLKKINEKGKTVIIITHNMEIVNRYCNRVLTMVKGKLILDGTPKEVFVHKKELAEAHVRPTDITYIAQNLNYMPDNILSVNEFYTTFKKVINQEAAKC